MVVIQWIKWMVWMVAAWMFFRTWASPFIQELRRFLMEFVVKRCRPAWSPWTANKFAGYCWKLSMSQWVRKIVLNDRQIMLLTDVIENSHRKWNLWNHHIKLKVGFMNHDSWGNPMMKPSLRICKDGHLRHNTNQLSNCFMCH